MLEFLKKLYIYILTIKKGRHSIRRRFPRRIRAHDNLHNIAENLYPQGSDSNSNDSNSTNDYAETREQLTSLIPRLYSNVDLPSLVRSGRNSPPPPPPPPPPEMSPEDETPARLMWSSSWATDDMARSPRSNGGGRFSVRLPLAREMPPEEYDIPLVLPHQFSAGPGGPSSQRDSYMEPLVPPPPQSISQNMSVVTDTMMPGRDRTTSSFNRPQVHFTNPPVAGTIPRETGSLLDDIEHSRSLRQTNSTYHNSGSRSSPPRLNAYRQAQVQALQIHNEEHAQQRQRAHQQQIQQQSPPQFSDPNVTSLTSSASQSIRLARINPSATTAEVDQSSSAGGAPSPSPATATTAAISSSTISTTPPLASLTEPTSSMRLNPPLDHSSNDRNEDPPLGPVPSTRPTEESVIFLARRYWNSPFNRMLSGSDNSDERAWSQRPVSATVGREGGGGGATVSLRRQSDDGDFTSNHGDHSDHRDHESRLQHQYQQHHPLGRGPSLMASIRAYSETPHNPGNVPDCPRR